ncbi:MULTISPECIES: NAD(P)H-binding protein [Vibrio]|uniref:NAD(P)H-binding protein n=2 Tax=Vibrio TaxID=662 RepID=A0A7X4RVA8_9VIBR|nr:MULTISPECIES: NAD(P)H-binding protein [Vibrio]MBF9002210.1 NAD(P)H-binding protein [Vibrio nitrifigilis]MZI94132.1 NAD(P)H-binding protein [Vibrio eleionomae]
MSSVFVVGAAGKVGHQLVRKLVKNGHDVLGMVRNDEQQELLREYGSHAVYGDLLELAVHELASLMKDSECVVFTAGAGGKGGEAMTNAIDGKGLELCVDAALLAKVPRFILVSAFPEAGRAKFISDTFENYMQVKKAADVYLAQSTLKWVILRPGTLTDTVGSGLVNMGPAIPYGDISREDVAATLVALVEHEEVEKRIIELTQGDTFIEQSIRKLNE